MQENERVFLAWAPPARSWYAWAKPVLFAHAVDRLLTYHDGPSNRPDVTPPWIERVDGTTAVILDVPGPMSVIVGAQLAAKGYAPVPLFNGCPGGAGTEFVTASEIVPQLWKLADDLERVSLAIDAPPVFLLDSHRMANGRSPAPGDFDNRWMVFPQDFPSGNLLRERGISRAVVVGAGGMSADLKHVLAGWQRAGLQIFRGTFESPEPPQLMTVSEPSLLQRLLHRFSAAIPLRRNSVGGFGRIVPTPSQGYGGGFS